MPGLCFPFRGRQVDARAALKLGLSQTTRKRNLIHFFCLGSTWQHGIKIVLQGKQPLRWRVCLRQSKRPERIGGQKAGRLARLSKPNVTFLE